MNEYNYYTDTFSIYILTIIKGDPPWIDINPPC